MIRACHVRSRATYGSPRIHQDLRALDYRVSRKRVSGRSGLKEAAAIACELVSLLELARDGGLLCPEPEHTAADTHHC
jgi:hypothetical protein